MEDTKLENKNARTGITLMIVMITSFIAPFMIGAVNLAIPAIGIEFGADQSQINWVVSGYLLASAAFLLPFGRLADQYGRRKIYLIGVAMLGIAALGCALARSLAVLIFFRVFQGIASSMIFATAMAILTSVVPPQSRGKALGFNSAATYVGLSVGPVAGGFVSSNFSWRAIFILNVIICAILLALTLWKLKGEWKGESKKLDGGGIALCILSQFLLLFGLTDLTAGLLNQIGCALGVILLAVFFVYEKRREDPLIPIEAIGKNKVFVFANLATLINYSATFALSFLLSLYLQAALRLDGGVSGLILLVQPVLMAVLSPVTGALSDRVSSSVLASTGIGISAVGLFLFSFLTINTPVILIIANLALIGIGFALFASPNTNAIMSSVDISLYGIASSFLGNMRLIGQSFSMAVVSIITSIYIRDLPLGSYEYVEQLMVSLRAAFIVFAVLCLLGVFASLVKMSAARQK
ncbi:MAG: MFS transporter [Clostridiales bacterium]|nr:MFS transporter [Clostridiales bacterium]